jgi:hypothetical protein
MLKQNYWVSLKKSVISKFRTFCVIALVTHPGINAPNCWLTSTSSVTGLLPLSSWDRIKVQLGNWNSILYPTYIYFRHIRHINLHNWNNLRRPFDPYQFCSTNDTLGRLICTITHSCKQKQDIKCLPGQIQ